MSDVATLRPASTPGNSKLASAPVAKTWIGGRPTSTVEGWSSWRKRSTQPAIGSSESSCSGPRAYRRSSPSSSGGWAKVSGVSALQRYLCVGQSWQRKSG